MEQKEKGVELFYTPEADAKIDNSLQNEEESSDYLQDDDSLSVTDDEGMGDDYDEDILKQDLQSLISETQENIGVFSIKQANKVMSEARERPDPVSLYDKLWYEHELCCLFADSNLGKSIFAIQMAEKIARDGRKKVVYFDFEMSDKSFQVRYTTKDGVMHTFPDLFYRAEVDRNKVDENFDENLLPQIEMAMVESRADVVIIDNLTWICAESEKGGDAAKLMMSLKNIWKKYDSSMLIVAHTPKRDMSRPITANDLAGSRKIFNFFDSVIAIGRSAKDENLRYIKQVKVRTGGFSYDTENVIVCSIEQDSEGFLHFVSQGCAAEREHLRKPSERDVAALKEQVLALSQEGMPYKVIAYKCGISKSYVCRIINGK